MPLSLTEFAEQLIASSLMAAEDVSSILSLLPAEKQPQDGEQLARELVKQKKLTKFQAEQIYAGKGKSLTLGNYILLDKLGQGGMGMVLKAQHKRLKRLVALKVMSPVAVKTPDSLKRFHREVEAAAKLRHPNIVATDDADEAKGTHFLVMEYVEGSDLSALVKKNGPLSVEQALNCILQAARGLDYAHRQGVVHRDIKPANMLIDPSGTVKILDMGLARIEGETGAQAELTSTGAVMGTVDYMAPEQALSTKTADARSDIYSLGISLWYLLTGKCAYEGDTLMAKLLAHRESPIPSLREIRSEVTESVDAVFQRMVAKKAQDRCQSMTEVIAEIERCLSGGTATVTLNRSSSAGSGDSLQQFLQEISGDSPSQVTTNNPASKTVTAKSKTAVGAESAFTETMISSSDNGATDPQTQTSLMKSDRAKRLGHTLLSSPRGKWIAAAIAMSLLLGVVFLLPGKKNSADKKSEIAAKGSESSSVADKDGHFPASPPSAAASTSIKAPPPAVAPFDAATAKRHQEAWAKYLGEPVEKDITLPGGEKLTMVLIPPGEFLMGSMEDEQNNALEEAKAADDQWAFARIPSEGPQHRMRITRPFYLGKYEVTQAQWESVMGSTPSQFKDNPSHPVEQVSWDEIQPFLAKLNESGSADRMKFALPSEAQWEYACRSGTTTSYYGGVGENESREYFWFDGNSGGKTHPVGELKPNGFGLYDMHGNVWEWCADWYASDYYAKSPADDPTGPSTGLSRVLRGGSWYRPPSACRSALRRDYSPDRPHYDLGFRLAVSIDDANLKTKSTVTAPPAIQNAPLPAVAPFDEAQAKAHQEAWAKYLDIPVEYENSIGMKFRLIPPGEFLMGSTPDEISATIQITRDSESEFVRKGIASEAPQHKVVLTQPFYLGVTELTQAQYQQVMRNNPSHFSEIGERKELVAGLDTGRFPVEMVSWNDAAEFCVKLSQQETLKPFYAVNDETVTPLAGTGYRLPTEAEWEFACRAGTTTRFWSGNTDKDLLSTAWFRDNSDAHNGSVGELRTNSFGLSDMHGNVWEWVQDGWVPDFIASSRIIQQLTLTVRFLIRPDECSGAAVDLCTRGVAARRIAPLFFRNTLATTSAFVWRWRSMR